MHEACDVHSDGRDWVCHACGARWIGGEAPTRCVADEVASGRRVGRLVRVAGAIVVVVFMAIWWFGG